MSKMSLSVDPRYGKPTKAAAVEPPLTHTALALPDPAVATVAAMHDGCRRVEVWMAETTDVDRLDEARHWLAAVERYLEAKDAQGPAQTTARLLEARIGELLGPAENHGRSTVSRDGTVEPNRTIRVPTNG